MQTTIFVIMAIVKVKLWCYARYDDVTKKGNVPLYDLRKYEIKIRDKSILKRNCIVNMDVISDLTSTHNRVITGVVIQFMTQRYALNNRHGVNYTEM